MSALTVAVGLVGVALTSCGRDPKGPTSPTAGLEQAALFPPPPAPPAANALDDLLTTCPGADDLRSVSDIPVRFIGDADAGALVCTAAAGSADLTRLQERLYQALLLMKRLRFDRPLPWTDRTLYEWFRALVAGVEFRTDIPNSFCCSPARVIQIKATLTWSDLRWPAVETLISGLVHEARHIDVGPHTCGSTRDQTVDELGAFGVHNRLFTWIAEYAAADVVPLAYRSEARWKACTQRNSAFCQEPPRDCRNLQ